VAWFDLGKCRDGRPQRFSCCVLCLSLFIGCCTCAAQHCASLLQLGAHATMLPSATAACNPGEHLPGLTVIRTTFPGASG
jgi:hypothetical protein